MSGTPGWEQDGVAPGATRTDGLSPAAQARVRVPHETKGRDLIPRRALGRMLLATLGGSGCDRWELDAVLGRPAGVGLVEAADRHGVVGYLREAARQAPYVHAQVAAVLDSFYEQAVRTHLRALADLALIGRVLDGGGVPWAVVKGPVLAETVYSRFDLRAYRDLDVLVAPAAFPDALRALEAAGASLYDRNWTLLRAGMKGQLHLTLPHGSLCDLHWHLLHDREVRDVYRLPSAAFLGGVGRVVLGGVSVPSLNPVDTFVHLAVHACLSGADRLVWLKDVDEIVRRVPPEWEGVVEKARAAGAGLAVAAVLELVRRVLGTPAPSGAVTALDPAGGWTWMVALATRISPPQVATGDGSILRIVARSTRPTLGGSMAELASRSLSLARHPRSSSLQGRMALRNPSRSTSALYPSGGARERRAYLDAVAAHDEDAIY